MRLVNRTKMWLFNPKLARWNLMAVCVFGMLYSNIENSIFQIITIVLFTFFLLIVSPFLLSFLKQLDREGEIFGDYVELRESIPDLDALISKTGIRFRIFIAENGFNAKIDSRKNITIGKPLIDRLGKTYWIAVVAHEVAHKQNRDFIKFVVTIALIMALWAVYFIYIKKFNSESDGTIFTISVISMLSFVLATVSFLSWKFEYNADFRGASYIAPRDYLNALIGMQKLRDHDTGDYRHPSISSRIFKLQKSLGI